MQKISSNSHINGIYRQVKCATLRKLKLSVPIDLASYSVNLQGYEIVYILTSWLREKDNILVIGDEGGRDYWYLTALGKKVTVLDIAPQRNIPSLTIGKASALPFKNCSFDAVVMGEVVEHLFEDVPALLSIRRVLKTSGILILTCPYFHDSAEYHARIHSAKTIRRLFKYTGWKVTDSIKKGVLSGHDYFIKLMYHPILFLLFLLLKQSYYPECLTLLTRIDIYLGRKLLTNSNLWRGEYFKLVPTERSFELMKLNIVHFTK